MVGRSVIMNTSKPHLECPYCGVVLQIADIVNKQCRLCKNRIILIQRETLDRGKRQLITRTTVVKG